MTAEWQDLLLLNYLVDPAVLAKYVPPGVELAEHDGRTWLSVVGFHFEKTRLRGLPVPFHRRFPEVNLRFYVRRRTTGGWRQGVVFIKEIVPKWSLAAVARALYGERYVSFPMRHRVAGGDGRPRTVEYWWYPPARLNHLGATLTGVLQRPDVHSTEAFLLENYWGYVERNGVTREYRVEHEPWRVQPVTEATLDCDVATLYGPELTEALSAAPQAAFFAEGGPVAIYRAARV